MDRWIPDSIHLFFLRENLKTQKGKARKHKTKISYIVFKETFVFEDKYKQYPELHRNQDNIYFLHFFSFQVDVMKSYMKNGIADIRQGNHFVFNFKTISLLLIINVINVIQSHIV